MGIKEEEVKNGKTKTTLIHANLKRFTFESPKIKMWVESVCIGKTLNLFAGKTKLDIEEYRVDINPKMVCDYVSDALTFVLECNTEYDTVLLDPPYSYRKSMEMYEGAFTSRFKRIADNLDKITSRVVSFGYHSSFMGKVRDYILKEICVFAHGGAQHCTIAIVEEKEGSKARDMVVK